MKSFEYATPGSLAEAIELLADTWGQTEILAGGTDLVTSLKQHITAPKRVVSLKKVAELRGIRAEKDALHVGAMTTLADFVAHPAIKEHFPALVTAVKSIASPQTINAGTVGGDLCQRPRCWYFRNGFGLFGKEGDAALVREGDNRYHAILGNDGPALFVSPSSLGPGLVALGATVTIAGAKGKKRHLAAAEFFRTPKADNERETALNPAEILVEIQLPIKGLKNATYEVRHRHGFDWPYVTATVAFQLKGGTVSDARVVLGHVAPVPWSVTKAAAVLDGAKVDAALAAKCGETATQGARPLSGNAYKVQLVKTAVKRAVQEAAGV